MSGCLFNLYNNKIPLLSKLINTNIYYKMGGAKLNTKNIFHNITKYVEDNSNIISFKNHEKIKVYLENFFILLEKYHFINKIKLNNDKTKLIIVYKNSMDKLFKNFTFKAVNEIMKNNYSIKILGTIYKADVKMDKTINTLSSELHKKFIILQN